MILLRGEVHRRGPLVCVGRSSFCLPRTAKNQRADDGECENMVVKKLKMRGSVHNNLLAELQAMENFVSLTAFVLV